MPTCSICGPIEVEQKQRDTKKQKNKAFSGDFSEISCSLCRKIKKRKKTKGYDYVDENGNRWLRRRCPDCRPAMIYKQNIKRERKLEDRGCITCKKMFRPKNARHLYCSSECTQSQSKAQPNVQHHNEVMVAAEKINSKYSKTFKNLADLPDSMFGKEEVLAKDLPATTCLYCNKKTKAKVYCNKKCANAYQYANNEQFRARLKNVKERLKKSSAYKKWRQYKRTWGDKITSKARLPGVTWKDLDVFFNNCPSNHKIEIVVPLYDENVCGLFVPWNFSYIKKAQDIK